MFRYERKRGERKERVNVQNYTTGRVMWVEEQTKHREREREKKEVEKKKRERGERRGGEQGCAGGLNLREYVVHHEYGGPRYYTYHSRV